MRETTQIREFYQNSKYANVVPGYTFNYSYDILPSNVTGDDLIPPYIRVIMEANQSETFYFAGKVAYRLKKEQKDEPFLSKNDKMMLQAVFKDNANGIEKEEANKIRTTVSDYDMKIKNFNKLIGFINYPSNLPNQIVRLTFKIKDMETFKFTNSDALSSDLVKKIKNSKGVIPVNLHSIFNKGARASKCPRCQTHKTSIKDLVNYLQGYLYPFYVDLVVNSNYGYVYHSKDSSKVEKNFDEIVDFQHECNNERFRFENLKGAASIKFRSKFVKSIEKENS